MKVYGQEMCISTNGFSDIRNITGEVKGVVKKSGIQEGLVHVFIIGSTASISSIEYEPALVQDMKDILEKLVSKKTRSRHSETWGDDNGFSHMRATLMGPGTSFPVTKGDVLLGTWQQIIVIDHDNHPRNRRIYIQVMGIE
jgi:secondary thiamine-phosphate synthase enzyme